MSGPKNIDGTDDMAPTFQIQAQQQFELQSAQDKMKEQKYIVDDADSTDVSKVDVFLPMRKKKVPGETRQTLQDRNQYDWSEVAYLFEDGVIPTELLQITDPIEYNYLIVRLKKEFNEKHRSDYLRYMHLDLPYHSRRDDLGGFISE